MTSPTDTAFHTIRSEIEPSSMDLRNCRGVRRRLRPRATLASGAALKTYQTSVLPFGRPIERANASLGCTWMESGWLVNSNLSKREGSTSALSALSYQISPIASSWWLTLHQGNRSETPHGFGIARARVQPP